MPSGRSAPPSAQREPLLAVAVATGSAQSLGQRASGQDGNSPRFSLLRGLGELGGPCSGKRFSPQMYNFRSWKEDIFQSLKNALSPAAQLFYYQDHCQGNPRILIPLVWSPFGGWHQGAQELVDPAHPSATIHPSLAPFLSYPLSPSLYPPAPTQPLHGKSPSTFRSVTIQEKTVGDRPDVLTNLS